jgi:hypothetical protein
MAKWNRTTVGTVIKGKPQLDGSPGKPYVRLKFYKPEHKQAFVNAVNNAVDGLILNLESKKAQLDSLAEAVTSGRLEPASAEKMIARAEKIPDFVLFEVVLSQKQE